MRTKNFAMNSTVPIPHCRPQMPITSEIFVYWLTRSCSLARPSVHAFDLEGKRRLVIQAGYGRTRRIVSAANEKRARDPRVGNVSGSKARQKAAAESVTRRT